MKIALYIEDGLEQIVLTPEDEFEQVLLRRIRQPRSLSIETAGFIETMGGYIRQVNPSDHKIRESTLIILRPLVVESASSAESGHAEPPTLAA